MKLKNLNMKTIIRFITKMLLILFGFILHIVITQIPIKVGTSYSGQTIISNNIPVYIANGIIRGVLSASIVYLIIYFLNSQIIYSKILTARR
jgi:hypothetical protein